MKTRILLFLCLFSVITANAQTDSLTIANVVESDAATTIPAITNKQYNLNYAHHSFCVALPVTTVGILTAELAYWATDAIFKDRKLFKSHYNVNADYIIKNY